MLISSAPEPTRVKILEAIQAGMERDIVAGPVYFNTLVTKVFIGRTRFDSSDPLPYVTLLEVPVQPEQLQVERGQPINAGRWELIIQGFCQEPSARDCRFLTRAAYELEQDVRCWLLSQVRPARGGPTSAVNVSYPFGFKGITSAVVSRGVVLSDSEQSDVSTFYAPLTLHLAGA